MSGIEQSIARDGGIVNVCGKLLKAINNHEQQAIFFIKKRSDRPGVTYFRTPNYLESRDPQRPEPERRNPERRVPQCLLSVLERTILEELDWISSARSNPIRSSQPKATCHLRKVLEQPEPERSSPRLDPLVIRDGFARACVREPGRTCVCTLKLFPHARVYACVRNVPLAHKAICMLS